MPRKNTFTQIAVSKSIGTLELLEKLERLYKTHEPDPDGRPLPRYAVVHRAFAREVERLEGAGK